MTIVRTTYRYQRPPRKRQAAALEVPTVVKVISKWTTRPQPAPGNPEPAAPPTPANAVYQHRLGPPRSIAGTLGGRLRLLLHFEYRQRACTAGCVVHGRTAEIPATG
jgi:hypothetical protein